MKKYYGLLVFVLAVAGLFAMDEGNALPGKLQSKMAFQLNMGLDVGGSHEITTEYEGLSATNKLDANTGFTPGIEVLKRGKGFGLGLGVDYEMTRDVVFEDEESGATLNAGVSFIPIYLIAKYNHPLKNGMALEPAMHLGYNFFSYDDNYASDIDEEDWYMHVDSKGGLYLGVGLNWVLKNNMVLRLFSKTNMASMDIEYGEDTYRSWNVYDMNSDITHSQVELGVAYRF